MEQNSAKEQAVRQFVGLVDPKSEDAQCDYVTILRRAQGGHRARTLYLDERSGARSQPVWHDRECATTAASL